MPWQTVLAIFGIIASFVFVFFRLYKEHQIEKIRLRAEEDKKKRNAKVDSTESKTEKNKDKIRQDAKSAEKVLKDKERELVVRGAGSLEDLADAWNERFKKK